MLIGKKISQLPSLSAATSATTIPVESSTLTYNITVDTLSKSDSFTNNFANFYSNPSLISKDLIIPNDVNAMIIGPTATTSPSIIISIGTGSTLTIV